MFAFLSPLVSLTLFTEDDVIKVWSIHESIFLSLMECYCEPIEEGLYQPYCRITENLKTDSYIYFQCECKKSCWTQMFSEKLQQFYADNMGKTMLIAFGNVHKNDYKYLQNVVSFIEEGICLMDAKYIVSEVTLLSK